MSKNSKNSKNTKTEQTEVKRGPGREPLPLKIGDFLLPTKRTCSVTGRQCAYNRTKFVADWPRIAEATGMTPAEYFDTWSSVGGRGKVADENRGIWLTQQIAKAKTELATMEAELATWVKEHPDGMTTLPRKRASAKPAASAKRTSAKPAAPAKRTSAKRASAKPAPTPA